MSNKICLTGGAGYIGSHVAVTLVQNGYEIFIMDNFSNCKYNSIENLSKACNTKINFANVDIKNEDDLDIYFQTFGPFDAVIHLAGYKAVNESVNNPLKYYENNLISTISLLKSMKRNECKNLLFSSSAAVYGVPQFLPITELHPKNPTNPYGNTKLISEQIMEDFVNSETDMKIIALRYFNPVGSHESGFIGENPNQCPSNLVPLVCKVAKGELPTVNVFGNNWNTKDGTGERDFIHVVDLAEGHLAALQYMLNDKSTSMWEIYNLGTGTSYSVNEIIQKITEVSKKTIHTTYVGNREGDVAKCCADVSKAKKDLRWEAKFGLERMCSDAWSWENNLGKQEREKEKEE